MIESTDRSERPLIYSRAEPDDLYDPPPEPEDPYLIDQDEYESEELEIFDEDDEDDG